MSKDIISFFADYTKTVVDALSDRVTYWLPMNEPQCFIMNGHMVGAHAPFLKRYLALPKLTRNCLSAFHQSVEIIRSKAKIPPRIGIAMAASAFIPENESTEEIAIARHKSFFYKSGIMSNRWWSDPLFLGKTVRAYGIYSLKEADIQHIQTKLDFIGLNVYSPFGENWNGTNENVPNEKKNYLGWVNDGRCLYWTIRFFNERYSLPIMVTENGLCDDDEISANSHVSDSKRIEYLKEYLGNVKRAVEEGIPVLGYQYWSLMDNFEWAEGYTPRFGIIHVDFDTQKRTPKDSAFLYRKIIETNGASL